MGALSLVIRGIVFVIGIPFLLFGLFVLAVSGFGAYAEYQETQGIASTQGTIQSATLEEGTDDFGDPVYYPRATYTYSVDGRQYEGQHVYAANERGDRGKSFEDLTDAQKVTREYREGSTVKVYYYKGNPGEPFLERPTFGWGAIIAGLLFGGIPFAIGVVLSGGALLFGQIRKRFGSSDDVDGTDSVTPDVDEAGWEDEDWDDDDGGGGGDDGGGWGGLGGFDGGGDGGGGGGGE